MVADDRDVDALVAAEVPAVVGEAVARVPDDEPVQHERTTGVAEARAATAARIVLVAVGLDDLIRHLLARLGREAPHDRLPLGHRLPRTGVGLADLGAVADGGEERLVQLRLLERREVVRRRERCRREAGGLVEHDDAGVVPVLQVGEVAVVGMRVRGAEEPRLLTLVPRRRDVCGRVADVGRPLSSGPESSAARGMSVSDSSSVREISGSNVTMTLPTSRNVQCAAVSTTRGR